MKLRVMLEIDDKEAEKLPKPPTVQELMQTYSEEVFNLRKHGYDIDVNIRYVETMFERVPSRPE